MVPFSEAELGLVAEKAFGEGEVATYTKGYLKGLRHGAAEILNTQLQIRLRMRFWVRARIEALQFHDLGQLGVDMLDFQTLDDLEKWLGQHERAAAARANRTLE